MIKTKIQNLVTPIDIDAHLKYRCADPDCGFDHWISLKESQTKNFIIVCDCGSRIKPKRIGKISIKYKQTKKQKPPISVKQEEIKQEDIKATPHETVADIKEQEHTIPKDILKKSILIMSKFGFTNDEAEKILKDFYKINPVNDCINLVKQSIASLGVHNE